MVIFQLPSFLLPFWVWGEVSFLPSHCWSWLWERTSLRRRLCRQLVWECNGSSVLEDRYLGVISIFRPLFIAVLEADLAKEQPAVLPGLPPGTDPVACRHFYLSEECCWLSFSDWVAFDGHKAQAAASRGPLRRWPVSTVSQSNSLPSVRTLAGCSAGSDVGKNCSWKSVVNFGFKSSGSEKALKRLSVYYKMLWLSWKGFLLSVLF